MCDNINEIGGMTNQETQLQDSSIEHVLLAFVVVTTTRYPIKLGIAAYYFMDSNAVQIVTTNHQQLLRFL